MNIHYLAKNKMRRYNHIIIPIILGLLLVVFFSVKSLIKIRKPKSYESCSYLTHMKKLQDVHKLLYGYYSTRIDTILEIDSIVESRYLFQVEIKSEQNFVIKSTDKYDLDQDGKLNIWQIDTSGICIELTSH